MSNRVATIAPDRRATPKLLPGQIPEPSLPATPTLDQHRVKIDTWWCESNSRGEAELAPLNALPAIAREIEATLGPAPKNYVLLCITTLAGSWPQHQPDSLEIYFGSLVEHTKQYAAPVLRQAVLELQRTSRFRPSIAEVVDQCEAFAKSARRPLDVLASMQRKHEQIREAKAESDAQYEVDAKHGAGRYRAWHSRLREFIEREPCRGLILTAAQRHVTDVINDAVRDCWGMSSRDRTEAWKRFYEFAKGEPVVP